MRKLLFANRGFAVIEALVAAAIIGVSMLGLGVGLKKVSQSRNYVRGVSTALSLESGLQAAMLDPNQYSDIKDVLSAGTNTVPNFTYKVRVSDQQGNETTIDFPINQDVQFTADGAPCTSCTDWIFKARIEGAMKSSATIPIYAMAYRFQFNSNAISLANLGATSSMNFAPEDFKWMIPIEAYQNASLQSCQIGNRDVIVTGINRDNMQVNCLKVGDNTQCAADEIATGWTYAHTPASGGPLRQLRMGCRKLNAFPSCPSLGPGGYDYAINNLDPRTSTTATPSDQCVFVAKATADVALNTTGTTTSRTATFDVCPPHYNFQPDPSTNNGCYATVLTTLLGWRDAGCPAGQTGNNWVQDVAPAPLTTTGVIRNGGRTVDCTLQNDQQLLAANSPNNWSGYQARISVKGTCALSSPELR